MAQSISEAGRNDEDGKDLEKVGKRSRIFVRVRTVGVEESATVGAEHLDGFL